MSKNPIGRLLKEFKKDSIFTAIAIIVLGIILTFFPEKATNIICYVIGALLLAGGVIKLVEYFRAKAVEAFGSFGLVGGTLLAVIGLVFIVNPGVLAKIVTTVIAVILIADGVLKIQYAINLSRVDAGRWWVVLTVGIVMTLIGILAIFNPFETVAAFMMVVGIVLIISGVFDLITIFYVSKSVKAFDEAISAREALNVEAEPIDEE